MTEPMVSLSSIIIGLVSGGIINCGVLVWLALQYVKLNTRLAIIETHIQYLRKEVSYVNGRAEPEDDGEELK